MANNNKKQTYSKEDIKKIIINEARALGVPVDLALALAHHESGFNPNALSKAGAIGVMQLMPATAKGLGVNPYNAVQNIQGGLRYIKSKLNEFKGDTRLALAAYNAGSGNVRKYGGIPPFKETQNYVKNITASLPQWAKTGNEILGSAAKFVYDRTPLGMINNAANFIVNRKQSKGQESTNQEQKQPQSTTPVTVTDPQTGEQVEVQIPISQGSLLERLQGMATGGAADIQAENPIDALGWGEFTPRTTYEQARKDAIDAAKAVRDYASEQVLTPETFQGTLEQQLIDRQYGATPEQLQQAYQASNQGLQQAYGSIQNQDALTQQALQERYDNMRKIINSDPRLQNQGYYMNPDIVQRSNEAKIGMAMLGLDPRLIPTEVDTIRQQYETNIANQYGVPYQDFINSRLDNIQNLLGVDQLQLQNIIARANQGDITARQYLQAAMQAANDYQSNVGNMGQYQSDLVKQMLINQGNLREQGLQSYGNVMNTAAGAGFGIPTAMSGDRASVINAGINAQTTQRGQDIDAMLGGGKLAIDEAKLPSDIDAQRAEAQYKRSGALANLDYARVNPQLGSEAIYGYNLYPEDTKPTSGNNMLFRFMR